MAFVIKFGPKFLPIPRLVKRQPQWLNGRAVLWNNVQSTRGGPNPDPKPTQLKVQRVQNGYEVEWDAVNPVYRSKFRLQTRYTAEKVDGKLQLVCRDLTAPKGEERGVNCELGQLSRVF